MAAEQRTHYKTAIVGTGFAGQCMGIKLKERGDEDFILLERADSVGGTWRDNSYPGCACDVPSHLYSFSFAQNPDWSRKYPSQPELYEYLKKTARDYGLMPHVRFGANLENARYDEAAKRWVIETSAGEVTADRFVMANGALSEPAIPNFPGRDSFKGESFHSARWRHDLDLKGKRVAVIGTGASAIQFVPEIAPEVGDMDIYQRTPPWIIPRPDRQISGAEKWLLRHFKPYQWLFRQWIYWTHEARVMGIVLHPGFMKMFQKIAERHLKKQVPDEQLRKTLTPDYTIGCKRILISNDWYPALQRDNVSVLTDGVQKITEKGIVDSAGVEREYDVIIYNTGFYATGNPIADKVTGRDGKTLGQAWGNGEEAYLGTTVHGFPNLFLIVGPNTGLGHSSMVLMIEAQVKHIMKCYDLMEKEKIDEIEVKEAVQSGYNRRLQERLSGSVWATGCSSWYQNADGKITTLWPGFTFTFMRRTNEFRPSDFIAQGE
ncbi:MAG: flavin-containing monooxygenase [Pseudomonadota bacterium]